MVALPEPLVALPVLAGKLRPPRPSGLARPRLEGPLFDHLTRNPAGGLATVTAPAGSGKTALLAALVARAARSGLAVGWCRLTEDERSEAGLVALLSQALATACGSEIGVPAVRGIGGLLAALDALDAPILLLIDDCAAVAGTPAEHALARLLDLRSPRCAVALAGRSSLEVNLPRHRLSGALFEVSPADLAFRPGEVADLFASVFREPLSAAAVAALTRQTGGWAAGLTCYQLAVSGTGAAQREDAAGRPAAECRLFRSYLESEVLASLSADDRRLLVLTAHLDPLTGPRADALLGGSGAATRLAGLVRRGLPLEAADRDGLFIYHPALRSYLQTVFREELTDTEAEQWLGRSAGLDPVSTARPAPAASGPVLSRRRPGRIEVRCFGRFEIKVGATAVDLAPLRPRARSILRSLALHAGEPVHRERLVEWWWPEASSDLGLHRLQVAVSSIRQWLEATAPDLQLVRQHAAYLLVAPDGTVDVREFEACVAAAELAIRRGESGAATAQRSRALELYRGELLSEEGPAEFVVDTRERLRLSAAGNAFGLARLLQRAGQVSEAMAAVRRALEVDPYSDSAWRLLVELYDRAGDRAAADQARRHHRDLAAQLV